ncbi:hypothetical protein B1M_44754 [Burkholderia sp. TJI49]|nr:hypothetical protein B1M_44754 [Burkholderia sp. TJI49]
MRVSIRKGANRWRIGGALLSSSAAMARTDTNAPPGKHGADPRCRCALIQAGPAWQ